MKAELFNLIKRIFLKRAWVKVGLTFIGFGVSLIIPGFWEFIITNLLLKVEPGQNIERQIGLLQIITSLIFISSGLGILFLIFRDEQKKKDLGITVTENPCWIYWKGDKNKISPEYEYFLPLTLKTGYKPILVENLFAYRYVDGCICWNRKPRLIIRKSSRTIDYLEDYKTLQTAVYVDKYDSFNISYLRLARGPEKSTYNCEHLEDGEYELTITYRFIDSDQSKSTKVFLNQTKGSLKLIDALKPPPLLNDIILSNALKNKTISHEEYEKMKMINEQDRYLLIRVKEDYLNRGHELREDQLKLCETVFKKIMEKDPAYNK